MASTREIRRRIKTIKSTAQITKAMQMVAASKMRKAQQAAIDVRPFIRLVYRIQRRAVTRVADFTHPLLEVRPVKKRLVILVSSDKGLCGALNSNLFRLVGGTTIVRRSSSPLVARRRSSSPAHAASSSPIFRTGDTPRFAEARAIAAMARDLFLKGEVDEVILVATRFINTLTQQAVAIEYLPIGEITGLRFPGAQPEEEPAGDTTEFRFEPDPESIRSYLLGHFLNILLHTVLLNAKASEQSARMVSMKSATDNANTMIKDLTLHYNKLRQGAITQELLEIAGGQAN